MSIKEESKAFVVEILQQIIKNLTKGVIKMAISYQAKDTVVLGRELKVQELSIPFVVTANATPGSVSVTCDEPAIAFFHTQGINQITAALDTSETLPTTYNGTKQTNGTYSGGTALPSATDASGIFFVLFKINEQLIKVISASITTRAIPGSASIPGAGASAFVTDPVTGGTVQSATSVGNKVFVGFDSANFNFATTNLDGTLTVKYIVHQ